MKRMLSMLLLCSLGAPLLQGRWLRGSSGASVADGTDSAAVAAIVGELDALYRDLDDDNWTTLVTHFYPAKVTARFAVPDHDPAWLALAAPTLDTRAPTTFSGHCAPAAAVAIVGSWARVRARRCTGSIDELWFYSMSGRWKIIHLIFGVATTASIARPCEFPRTTSRAVASRVSFAACQKSFPSTTVTISSPSTGEHPSSSSSSTTTSAAP
jgi:hypothetical protein